MKTLFIAGLTWFSLCSLAAEQPNIIYIMADDLGYGDVQCYNPESTLPTPCLNALAKEGAVFTDAHSAASVCTPSRYSALTGRYCWRTRLKKSVLWTTFDEPLIPPSRMTVASLLKNAGYATACVGKWHLGLDFYKLDSDELIRGKQNHYKGTHGMREIDLKRPSSCSPNHVGFDYSFISGAGHNMEPFAFIENGIILGDVTEWRETHSPTPRKPEASALESHEGWMATDWDDELVDQAFFDQALKFITERKKADPKQPIFLYLTPVSPHRPCVPEAEFQGRTGLDLRADYVAQLDHQIGEFVAAIDALGMKENTLIMVTSDNGAVGGGKGHKSCGDLKGNKGTISEGGHRVPFIVRWPGVTPAGQHSNELLCQVGLLATCAEIIGQELPEDAGEDSFSFLSNLQGKKTQTPLVVHQSRIGLQALRAGEWKLIPQGKERALFNMAEDHLETRNLIEKHPETVQRMEKQLKDIQDSGRSR